MILINVDLKIYLHFHTNIVLVSSFEKKIHTSLVLISNHF